MSIEEVNQVNFLDKMVITVNLKAPGLFSWNRKTSGIVDEEEVYR